MAKAWSDWFDEVLPDVPGCPQNVASNAIKNAAIEFCERGLAYIVDHPAVDGVADQSTYDWNPGAGLRIVRPETVWYDKKELTPKTRDELAAMYAYWPDEVGTPVYFVQDGLEQFILVPKPEADLVGAVRAKVTVRPDRTATTIDDAIWENYLEQIAYGAKAKLLKMQRKPWTNYPLGNEYLAKFNDAIDAVRLDSFKGFTRARNNRTRGYRRFM